MNPKAKGGSFERAIAKRLSLWITNGKSEDVLWRSSLSGGRATVARKKGQSVRQSGDLCAVAPEGHAFCDLYYCELKHYRDLQFGQFLIKGSGILHKFWTLTRKEAAHYYKQPLMIVRQNGWPILVISNPDGFTKWGLLTPTIQKTDVCDIIYLEYLLEFSYQ